MVQLVLKPFSRLCCMLFMMVMMLLLPYTAVALISLTCSLGRMLSPNNNVPRDVPGDVPRQDLKF